MEKYGFVYIWYDKKHKMYYIGCHWGTEDDGYICSSHRMRNAHYRRPYDFKRRILSKIYTNWRDLYFEELRWLYMIPEHQLGKKYYNLRTFIDHWNNHEQKSLSIKEKLRNNKKRKATWEKKFAEGYQVHNKGKKNPEHSERMN